MPLVVVLPASVSVLTAIARCCFSPCWSGALLLRLLLPALVSAVTAIAHCCSFPCWSSALLLPLLLFLLPILLFPFPPHGFSIPSLQHRFLALCRLHIRADQPFLLQRHSLPPQQLLQPFDFLEQGPQVLQLPSLSAVLHTVQLEVGQAQGQTPLPVLQLLLCPGQVLQLCRLPLQLRVHVGDPFLCTAHLAQFLQVLHQLLLLRGHECSPITFPLLLPLRLRLLMRLHLLPQCVLPLCSLL